MLGRLLGAALVAEGVRAERGQEGRPMGSGLGAEGLGRLWGWGWGAKPLSTPCVALTARPLWPHRACTSGPSPVAPQPLWKGAEGNAQWVNTGNGWWHRAHCPYS